MDLDPEDVFKDDEDDPDNESFQQSESSKEYVVYLVDASPKMFSTSCPGQDQEESHFRVAISCIAESLKTMIISRSYDEVAICFFNTKEKKNLQDLSGVFVFNVPEREHLDMPTARLIKEFDGIEESFMKEIGSQYGIVPGSRENSLYNALWAAQALLRKGSAKTADKRILLFTNEDDPFGSLHGAAKADMTRTTLQRAKDAQDLGISIELLPLSHPDEEFNVSAFYADLLGLDGEEVAQFMPSAGQKLEDMKDQLRKRMFTKRVVRRIEFHITNELSIGLNTYALFRPALPGAITWLDSVTNRPLKIERSLICEDTGALIEEPPKRFQSYRNDYVKFSVDEISEMKRISPGKLHLLGFKPLSCLKDYHNLRPSTFVYPSDQEVVGSKCIFIALHRSMLRHKRFAVAFHGSVSHPQLVALVAQIFPDTEDDAPEADEEQIQKAAALIKRIDVKDFSVCQFANPALQRHYAVLQALALEEDDIPETVDETLPDEEGLARSTVLKAVEAFKLSVYGEHYDVESDHLDKEKVGDASRKRKAEDAAKLSANYDWGNLADNGQLKDLTVAALKTYLNAHNLPVTGKKEALISRILTHMGKLIDSKSNFSDLYIVTNGTVSVNPSGPMCGNIQNVTFPFWGGDRAESCGHPELELTCQAGGVPQISIKSVNYLVIEININIQAFTVARTDYLNNLCPQKLANTTLDFALLDYAWNLENVTLYYDCPKISNQSSGFPSQFNCSNNGTGRVLNYYMLASAFGNLSAESKGGLGNCRSNVIVPAFYTAAQSIVTNPTPDTVILPLRNGFGLKWDANIASKCQKCEGSGGRCGYNKTSSGFTCYCPDHTDSSTCNLPGTNGMSLKIKLIIGFGVAGAAVLVVCLMVFTIRHKKQNVILMNFQKGRKKNSERIEAFIMKYGSDLAPKRYSFSDIKKITKSFKDKLGEGGFGTVFKGKLSDGRLVAVKVLSESNGDGEEFINEVASISRTSHVNVVAFLGFCYEGSMRALIYEFMQNGSLDKFICHQGSTDDDQTHNLLEPKTLFEIAIGIGRGLEYLHRGCNTRILHLDIKPHNILLDENFCPKISDFGLAKLCERKESILSMISARGTIGYIAPELFCRNFGGVSYKSDVYSYGMMVLEMVGAKENVHVAGSITNEMNFPLWVYEHLQQETYFNNNLQGITAEEEEITKKMIAVSLWCIQTNPSDRPSMTKVLEMLQGSLQSVPIPPRPFLFSPPRSSKPNSSSAISIFASSITMNVSEYE
ncbi:hypothetical protein CCACVL1_16506 [Corchorus capsularis]|uniref:non-specific serine/threonine protein kinase n=1 Tax=Corchorus capsularis TaxID=210143 RepID=A0A1R3HWS5_COCAP|nr:hypothetical protein CCACVL1_16506 [Corchorus capsularis]